MLEELILGSYRWRRQHWLWRKCGTKVCICRGSLRRRAVLGSSPS